MKTFFLPSAIKSFLFALIVLGANYTMQQVYAQTAMLTSMTTVTENTKKSHAEAAKSLNSFQAIAFPTENASKIKVIIEESTGNGALIVIRNTDGQILHQMNCSNKGLYARVFNLSVLPDGEYSLEIMALSKVGFVKQKYTHTFKLQSTTKRSITSWNKDLEKSLFTPRHYQVIH